jgi:hypothetical protein
MRTNKAAGMVLVQTTVHEVVHQWLVQVAEREGSSVASITRRLVMLAWEVAPDVPKRAPVRKPKRRKQLELPGTEKRKKARQTRTQKRGLNHIEPEAAQ